MVKKVGRPLGSTKYEKRYDEMAFVACSEGGFTVPKLAKLFGVDRSTVNNWMVKYPDFLESINKGRDIFDCATAEDCLLKRIKGYKYEETTQELVQGEESDNLKVTKIVTKSVAPDVPGIIFFLRNRDRKRWPDVRTNENTGKDGGPMIVQLSDLDAKL